MIEQIKERNELRFARDEAFKNVQDFQAWHDAMSDIDALLKEVERRNEISRANCARYAQRINELMAEVERLRTGLFPALAHGDDDHRRWLKEAIDAFIDSNPVPPPYGQGTKERLEAEVARLRGEVARAYREGWFYNTAWSDESLSLPQRLKWDVVKAWQASEARKRLEPPAPED